MKKLMFLILFALLLLPISAQASSDNQMWTEDEKTAVVENLKTLNETDVDINSDPFYQAPLNDKMSVGTNQAEEFVGTPATVIDERHVFNKTTINDKNEIEDIDKNVKFIRMGLI